MAPPPPYEEVVIDGDTSTDEEEEEDAVVVITPRARKRRRQSTIMDEDDEEVEPEAAPGSNTSINILPHESINIAQPSAQAQQQHQEAEEEDDDDDDVVEIIQIATPSSADANRKSRRLAIVDSDEEEEHVGETNEQKQEEEEEKEEIDDERRPPRASPGVVRPLRVEPVVRRGSNSSSSRGGATPNVTDPAMNMTPHANNDNNTQTGDRASLSSSSSSRRSSRIERKREEKEKLGPSARKLEFLSLDNCLDVTSDPPRRRARSHEGDDDSDEFIVDDEEEVYDDDDDVEEVEAPPPRKRQRASLLPPSRRSESSTRQYADGDDDLADFIADDNEVEYMDDDEEGVMDQALSSADEMDETQTDQDTMRATMQSREPSEWFSIYLRYLEESILDDDLDNKMRKNSKRLEYQLFRQAAHHIERAICSRRDALRSNVVWNDEIMDNLHCATKFYSSRCMATTDCQACRRANHYATQLIQFGGFACDATQLYRDNWMKKLRRAIGEMDPMSASFELGTVCHARTLGYWQLLHAKHFWVALVDAKRKEFGDGSGRIADEQRKIFHKTEFGRYKRLINLVDKFSTETSQSVAHMPNVWKKVTPTHVTSEFLPTLRRRGIAHAENDEDNTTRRGTMDSFVGDSGEATESENDEEEEEEEEEIMEEDSKPSARSALPPKQEEDRDEDTRRASKMTPRKQTRQSSIMAAFGNATTTQMSPQPDARVKNDLAPPPSSSSTNTGSSTLMKPVSEIDAEDLLCLVCRQNQRDGAIVHGHYLHFYCCFRCAKRQHAGKFGCMVCDRPIDRVFRILPLSTDARADILKQQTPS